MISTATTLVRRAIIDNGKGDQGQPGPEISGFGLLVFILTIFVFSLLMLATSYTYGRLIPVLCMVESPSTESYVPVSNLADANADPDVDQPPAYDDENGVPSHANEDALVRSQPVTSSIRATLLLLRSKGGYLSRFRGFGIFIVWDILRMMIMGMFLGVTPGAISQILGAVVAETLLAHLHMTWIHIVISEPTDKWWFRRIPRPVFGNWLKIAPAVAMWALAGHIAYALPMLVVGARAQHVNDPSYTPGSREVYATAGQMTGAVLLTITLVLALQIPATVCMVRVAASMLPEEDETVVAFDRTYGGKTTPAIVGGKGKIGIVEAWKTFTWESRKRLLILCVKVAGIMFALWAAFVVVVVIEAFLVVGVQNFGHFLQSAHGWVQ